MTRSSSRRGIRAAAALAAVAMAGARAAAQVQVARLQGSCSLGEFGSAAAGIGDIDGDGKDDLVVSEPTADTSAGVLCGGRVLVVSGAGFSTIRVHEGTQPWQQFGDSLAGLGDVDLDGTPDYAIASPREYVGSLVYAGRVRAFSGASGALLWTVDGAAANEYFGDQLTSIPDMDFDGRPELLEASRLDQVTIVRGTGSKGLVLATYGVAVSSIALARDLDGDLIDDLLVGSASYSGFLPAQGLVMAYSGMSGQFLTSFTGLAANDRIGARVAGLDDVDGDGWNDVVVSGRVDFTTDGMIEVRSGTTFLPIATILGGPADNLGRVLATVGDWNGDGRVDFAASAAGNGAAGVVRLYSGADASLLHEFAGEWQVSPPVHAHDFGNAIAGGDWNGDGTGDMVIGSYRWHDGAMAWEGAAFAWLGCPAFRQDYGVGWAGTLGIPVLAATGDPVVGQPITITATNSRGATTPGLLLVGFDPASNILASGATLLVDQPVVLPVSIPAAGMVMTDTIPDDPALDFVHVYLQVLEWDPGAVGRISFTQGVDLRCGFEL